MLTKEKLETTKFLSREIIKQIFEIFLVSYLLFYLLDQFFDRLVSDYININIFLIIIFICGVILNFFKPEIQEKKQSNKTINYLIIVGLTIMAAIFIYLKLEAIFWIKIFSATIGGIIIAFLTKVLFSIEDDI